MTTTLAAQRADKPATPRTAKSGRRRIIDYPTGDGKPMAEDVLHRKLMAYSCDALEFYFRERGDVHVAGNDFVYYEENNPKARVSPDCYVVIGVPKRLRHLYKIWEENGVAPSVVLEITSRKTRREDVEVKRPLYEQVLGVAEYFQFDPTGDYLHPRLQGQRLRDGRYEAIELRDNRMHSEQLGLDLVVEGETLRFYDPVRGEWLQTYAEVQAERLAQSQRAESADQRAESAEQRAESEKQRAESAEAELSRLRAELEALRQQR